MAGPQRGDRAPDFSLETDGGKPFTLSAAQGHPVVLFFYPQDDTQTCTVENIAFSGEAGAFKRLGVPVVGISPDTVASHRAFRNKHKLRIILAADPEHKAVGPYGVWGPKVLFGRHYDGLIRTTFLIDAEGRVSQRWDVTRVKGHAEAVLEATKALI